MTAAHQKRSGNTSAHQKTEPYVVVVATKQEGIDIVLYGLSPVQSERITAQKNREIDGDSSVHALPEKQIWESNQNLHQILTS